MPIQISGVQMGVITGGPSSLALEDLSNVSIVGPQSMQLPGIRFMVIVQIDTVKFNDRDDG